MAVSRNAGSKLKATAANKSVREAQCRECARFHTRTLGWMFEPTLSQAWTVDKPRSAMCVQNVDVHVSCSSHSDAQLAAFFIDPRAK